MPHSTPTMLLLLWSALVFYPLKNSSSADPTAHSVLTQRPSAPGSGWQYQQNGTLQKATLNSINQLELPYPYGGGSTVTLTIRNRDGAITVFFSVSKGLLASSFQGGTALIRINGGRLVTYALSAAANGRGNLLFVDDSPQLIKQLRIATVMIVQLKVAGQKTHKIRFNAAGLHLMQRTGLSGQVFQNKQRTARFEAGTYVSEDAVWVRELM